MLNLYFFIQLLPPAFLQVVPVQVLQVKGELVLCYIYSLSGYDSPVPWVILTKGNCSLCEIEKSSLKTYPETNYTTFLHIIIIQHYSERIILKKRDLNLIFVP